MTKLNIESLEHKELSIQGERFSFSAVLTEALGFKDLFVHHEVLPPGRRSSSPHFHTHREEMILVLAGSPIACRGTEEIQLRAGDFLGFQPKEEHCHFIENRTDNEVRFLVICSNPVNDQVRYPTKLSAIRVGGIGNA